MINFILAIILFFVFIILGAILDIYEVMKEPVLWSSFGFFFGVIVTVLFMTVEI